MSNELHNEYVLNKQDIAFYLLHYIEIMKSALSNPNIQFSCINAAIIKRLHDGKLPAGLTYYSATHIFQFFLLKRILSYKYDASFRNLKEDMINEINLPDNIFFHSNDKKYFSKKQILHNIRDGLNHNDFVDTYSFLYTKDILLIDIHVPWSKPIPFHIRMNLEDFLNIERLLVESKYSPNLSLLLSKKDIDYTNNDVIREINKIIVRRYNFDGNKNIDILNKIIESQKRGFAMNSNPYDKMECSSYKDYDLSLSQRLRAEAKILYFIFKKKVKPNLKLYTYVVSNLLQFGDAKIPYLEMDYFFCDFYMKYGDRCLNDFCNDALKYLNYKQKKNSPIQYIGDLYKSDFLLYMALSSDDILLQAYNVFISYMFDTFITDEYVDIGNKHIDRSKIRNSFVHGSFFIGNHEKYKLFDCKKGKKYEGDFNWSETISLYDLTDFCLGKLDYPFKKPKINVGVSLNMDGKSLSFIKDDVTYFCYFSPLIDKEHKLSPYILYKLEESSISQLEDINEIKFFVEQIKQLPDNELIKHKDLIRRILEELRNYNLTDKSKK